MKFVYNPFTCNLDWVSDTINITTATTTDLTGLLSGDGANISASTNITMPDGGTIGQAAGPLLTFDDTNNYLGITGASVGIGTVTASEALDVTGSALISGSLGATGSRLVKGWFTDLEITNVPTINGTALSSIYAAIGQTMYIGTTGVAINRGTGALTLAGITLTTPDIGTPSAGTLTNCSFPTLNQNTTGSSGSCTGNAATVTNAILTTALTVNTGTLTLTADVGNDSVLTIGGGAVSVSGSNTGDQTITDADVVFYDVTTNNASVDKHGFLPKLAGNQTNFLRADGTWSTPAGAGNVATSGTPVANDFARFVNATDIEGRSYSETLSDIGAEPAKGADDNYVTDAEKVVVGNTSGVNTGDQVDYTDTMARDAVGLILVDSSEIDFTYNNVTPSITADLKAASIDESKLDVSVNASLDLADSAIQSGDLATVATSGNHTDLSNIGTNTHAQIDTHIANVTTNPHAVDKTDVGLGNVANVDTTNASNITTGTLSSSVLPPVALTTVQVAGSEVAMLLLTTEEGDVVVRSDENRSYMRNAGTAGTMADFTELQTPTDSVLSVNGETGTVVLTTGDITEDVDDRFVTDAQLAALHPAVTVTDSTELDFTLTGQDLTASIKAASIDESKLDVSVNASLDLADSAIQSADLGSAAYEDTGFFAAALGADDNYVTDAEKTVIGNTSGANTGDQSVAYANTIGLTGLNDYSYNDLTNKPTIPTVSDTAYNEGTWDANVDGASKNAIRDKVVSMDSSIGTNTAKVSADASVDTHDDVDTTTDTPSTNEVLKWNGSDWVPAVYNYSFVFSIASFSDAQSTPQLIGSGEWKAIGALSFTATYTNGPPTAAVVQCADWVGDLDMGSPYTGPTTNTENVDYPASSGGNVTFTLDADKSAENDTDTERVYFYNYFKYDDVNKNSGFTDANITSLVGSIITNNEYRSVSITAGSGYYCVVAHRTGDGNIKQFRVGGMTAAFNKNDATAVAPLIEIVSHTNTAGETENFNVYASKLADLDGVGTTIQSVNSTTPLNYIFYGGSTTSTGWNEATIEALDEKEITSDSTQTWDEIALDASEYFIFALPSRFATPTFYDNDTGFEAAFEAPDTLNITNPAGFQEEYNIFRSENILGPGNFTLRTS